MISKLIFISIVVIISLVGWQTYNKFSPLNRIDTFESCIRAKGSVLQTTYPSTCVTVSGKQFTEKVSPLISSDSEYGFEITTPSSLIRSVTNVFGQPVILYCNTPITGDSNTCENYGISISVYKVPEFGGSCLNYQKLYIGKSLTDYCDDIESSMFTQIYVDRSNIGKNSYSILAKYSQEFSKEAAKEVLSSFKFTD